jgi:MFS family permease
METHEETHGNVGGQQQGPLREHAEPPVLVPEALWQAGGAAGTLATTFGSLRNYNYRLFFFGQLLSLTGTWTQTIGQAWLVLDLTHSPLALGTVTMLQFLPVSLFVLVGGVFADRVRKRRLLVLTQTAAMAQAFVLAFLTWSGLITLWQIYVLAAMLGLTNALDNPTRQAFVLEMVGREDVVNAVALNSSLFNSARLVGPALGGVVIAVVGIAATFFINGVSFIAVIIGLLLMKPDLLYSAPRSGTGHVLEQLAEGLRYSLRTPAILFILMLMAAIGTFGYNFTVVLPLLARNVLHVGSIGFGAMTSAMGVGSLLAALTLATLRKASRRTLVIGATAFSILLAAVAASQWYALTLVLLMALGVASIAFTATANSSLQITAPDHLRGRVMSLYMLLFLGTTPIGAGLTGVMAEHIGVRLTVGVEAAICAVGVAAALAYLGAQRAAGRAAIPAQAWGATGEERAGEKRS